MARRQNQQLVQVLIQLWRKYRRLSTNVQVILGILIVVGVGAYLYINYAPKQPQPPVSGTNPDGSGTYMIVFWNVENLFDDNDDDRRSVDEPYDDGFAFNPQLLDLKLNHISQALLNMNGGFGPDIIACCEVEGVRTTELLRERLNQKLQAKGHGDKRYDRQGVMDLNAGRHITPAVITRLGLQGPIEMPDARRRILETHIVVNEHDLCLVVSHWRSKVQSQDGDDGSDSRMEYANVIRTIYEKRARINPDTDFIACGDFNDTPDSIPVRLGLKTVPSLSQLLPTSSPPRLYDLFEGKSPQQYGTLYYREPLIYDHFVISPGMVDTQGWSCDPDSIATPTDGLKGIGAQRREPWRFGNPDDEPNNGRGYSDHFPITLTLKVAP